MSLIKGAFETSDWPSMINIVNNESKNQNIEAKSWGLERLHDMTEQQVNEMLESKGIEKNKGILVQGQILAYDVFTPTVEKIEQVPFDYKDYTKYECALFEMDEHTNTVNMIIDVNLENCKKWAGFRLTGFIQDRYKTFYISGKDGNYKVFNTESHMSTEPKNDKKGGQLVLPVHRYHWAVNV